MIYLLIIAAVIIIGLLIGIVVKSSSIGDLTDRLSSVESMLEHAEDQLSRYKAIGYLPDRINSVEAWVISYDKIDKIRIVSVKTSSEYDGTYPIHNVFATKQQAIDELITRKEKALEKAKKDYGRNDIERT